MSIGSLSWWCEPLLFIELAGNFIEVNALKELVDAFSCLEGTVLDQITFFKKNPSQNVIQPPKPTKKKTKRNTMLNVVSSQQDAIVREAKVVAKWKIYPLMS